MFRTLFGDFEADGSLACDDIGMVERRHDAGARPFDDFGGDRLPVVGPPVVEHDFGAEGPCVGDFYLGGIFGHYDRRFHAEAPA